MIRKSEKLVLIEKLRSRIYDYRKHYLSNSETINRDKFQCCSAIELAILFAEKWYIMNRKIAKEELVFFNGGRFISDIIGSDSEFEDIYDMYYELSDEINEIFQ